MATKPKSRIAKSNAKKSSFKFHWWMAVILVLFVAVVGIAVLRFSHAQNIPAQFRAVILNNRIDNTYTHVLTVSEVGAPKGTMNIDMRYFGYPNYYHDTFPNDCHWYKVDGNTNVGSTVTITTYCN
jgi:hypothetical protein